MKAILFAAGLGTRLGELTKTTPKALVRLNGRPLLAHAIEKLLQSGVRELMINVHHFADQIIGYINSTNFGIPIHISDEREKLLDTGGGLLKTRAFLEGNEPFIAYNVDVVTSLNLNEVISYHTLRNPLATLVVRQRETSRYFLFDQDDQLVGWENRQTGETILSRPTTEPPINMAFSGIQIISPEIFSWIEESGSFPITPLYLRLAKHHAIIGFHDLSDFWLDLGKPGQIELAEHYLIKSNNQHNKAI